MAPELVCDACGVARERQSLVAMLRVVPLHSQQRLVGAGRDLPRSDPRSARRADGPRRRAPDSRPHGAGARREGKRRLRGAVRALPGSRRPRKRVDSGGSCRRESGRRARVRSGRVLLPAGPGAGAGVAGCRRLEGRIRRRARERRPTGRGRRVLSARRRRSRSRSARRAPAARGRAVPHRRATSIAGSTSFARSSRAWACACLGSRRAALVWLLWRRARLRWRGLRFVPKPADDIDADALLRIDTCWSAATGLALVDMISASDFNVRHLLMALDAGDPYRIASAMAIESATRGGYPTGRTFRARLVRESKALARSIGNPHAIALSILADGMRGDDAGPMEERARRMAEQALAILRDQCVGVTWELNIAQNLMLWALLYQGELGELSRRVPAAPGQRAEHAETGTSPRSCAPGAAMCGSRQTSLTKGSESRSRASGDGRTKGFTVSTTARS